MPSIRLAEVRGIHHAMLAIERVRTGCTTRHTLFVEYVSAGVMFGGGPEPSCLDARLVTDVPAQLVSKVRALPRAYGHRAGRFHFLTPWARHPASCSAHIANHTRIRDRR